MLKTTKKQKKTKTKHKKKTHKKKKKKKPKKQKKPPTTTNTTNHKNTQNTHHPHHVSAVSDPREAGLMVSRSHRSPVLEPVIARLGITRIVPCGSVGVKVARVVTGAADLYLHYSNFLKNVT